MTRLTVASEVCAAFSGLCIHAIVAEGFQGEPQWPEVESRLAALEAGGLQAGDDDPHIASWNAAYRAFGTNPRRERPSVAALRRRLARSGRLPRINPAVDCYNLVSVSHGVPAGAFDLGQVSGDISVTFAGGSEVFTPLGEPGVTEHPRRGEVIYLDSAGVLTRHWNHRDADRTKVTQATDRIVFLLETVDVAGFGHRLDAAADDLVALLAEHAPVVTRHLLTAAAPAAAL